jgi:hypothetical protein
MALRWVVEWESVRFNLRNLLESLGLEPFDFEVDVMCCLTYLNIGGRVRTYEFTDLPYFGGININQQF